MPSEIPVATKEGFDYTQEPQRQNAPKGKRGNERYSNQAYLRTTL